MFAGGFGVTYGHHAIWQFYGPSVEKLNYPDRNWTEALDRPGAFQAGYLKNLILSRPSLNRIPDQSLIVSGQGNADAEHIVAFRDVDGSYAMIYLPVGKAIEINMEWVKGKKINAWWFNPRTGKSGRKFTFGAEGVSRFVPPALGGENDWVLVIDDAAKRYPRPGGK